MQVLEILVECPMFWKVCDKQLPQNKCFGSCLSFMHLQHDASNACYMNAHLCPTCAATT
jgi:hypothetical protein